MELMLNSLRYPFVFTKKISVPQCGKTRFSLTKKKYLVKLILYYLIRASGEVRAEGPNQAAQRTLGKMGIKNQPSAPRPPN